ncbi:MAG TPA: M20 aminoacylase family protein [Kiloniellaceae bacterium]|nr:M20 aminoacylase family protein [Kiloniellaceae bacterium]
MPVINRIAEFHEDMQAWRRDLHKHPETAFEEHRTAGIVAEKLESWGIEVHRGLAGTGVVGLLSGARDNGRCIGLRADLDALDIQESNDFEHRSVHAGKMHACGHDGHTAMLLGAARYLAETRNFEGKVAFIFQPAEENEGGARVMIEEGLFETFAMESVYGLHNLPGLSAGRAAMRKGPAMSAFDIFEITVTGVGTHAALPQKGVDPIVIGAQLISALQTLPSRRSDPLDSLVVSVTQFHAGETWNIIPESAVIRGTVRSFRKETQDRAEADLKRMAEGICAAQGASAKVRYERRYPAVVNAAAETDFCAEVAREVLGEANVDAESQPMMGSEDFAYMLQEKPGCYIMLGNGEGGGIGGCTLHNPGYDFNDEVAVLGASYWARLAEKALAKAG